MITQETLEEFTGLADNTRPIYSHGDRVIACDGHALIEVAADSYDGDATPMPEDVMFFAAYADAIHHIPCVDPIPQRVVDLVEGITECQKCGGTGECIDRCIMYWVGIVSNECGACEGRGWTCEENGKNVPYVEIDGERFSTFALQRIVALPNVRATVARCVFAGKPYTALVFRFDGGSGFQISVK